MVDLARIGAAPGLTHSGSNWAMAVDFATSCAVGCVLNSEPCRFIDQHLALRGGSVCAVGLLVPDSDPWHLV
jgi:4-hydroxyphenylpyruvate dioxygenase-like putative hemolysin